MDRFPMIPPEAVGEEMQQGELGDKRLEERAGQLAEMVATSPGEEFPEAAEDEAELEAAYRFWRNSRTGFEEVVEPHLEASTRRVEAKEQPMLAVHDTTSLDFGEQFRPGLGRLEGRARFGCYAHLTLAVQAEGPKLPHGVLHAELWRRGLPEEVSSKQRDASKDCLETKDDEGTKWWTGVREVERRLEAAEVIHVMDRGADSYERISKLVDNGCRFVVRANQNRRVVDEPSEVARPKLEDALHEAPVMFEKTIELGRRDQTGRPPASRRVHPSREGREAEVEVRARPVELRQPAEEADGEPETTRVNAVWVRELDPPEEGTPVDWRLYTTESIANAEALERILELYQRRWVIEEYNGVLKGACRVEERQLESAETLTTALGVMIPTAWRLLALRTMARHAPEGSAGRWLRRSQLEVLAEADKTHLESSEGVTLQEALKAIAKLGGHLEHNGPPGWKVLHRGYSKLRTREIGWYIGHFSGAEAMRNHVTKLVQNVDDLDQLRDELDEVESSDL